MEQVEIDANKLMENAMRDGIREGIKTKLNASYNNPFDKIINDAIAEHSASFREMLNDGLKSCLSDKEFRADIATAVRHTLAKVLVQRFGGELEKSVNALKSDPTTRARITIAIEEIVKQKTQ